MAPRELADAEAKRLSAISASLERSYSTEEDDPWDGSPFKWIKAQPSRTVGAIGESLVEGWCASKGFNVMRSPDSQADRIIEGHRVEIKFSTLWKNGGYKFQQIRNQNYEFCFCLGVSPFDVHAWLLPKAVLLEYVIGHMGQHTGNAGADTAWLGFTVGQEYQWMKPYGEKLSDVEILLRRAGRGNNVGR